MNLTKNTDGHSEKFRGVIISTMDLIVALDIETTGLDPNGDAIIEIGAVKFHDRRIESEWNTLVNPGRRIPPFITQLTGITDRMVFESPPISDVIADLASFVGDAPILGHNIRFDLSFFRKFGLFKYNESLDTYELASILLPNSERYNLSSLSQSLGIPLPATHRALDDAQVTRAVFNRLYEMALNLPLNILAEIVRLGENIEGWGGYWAFYQALRARSKEKVTAKAVRQGQLGVLFNGYNSSNIPSLKQNTEIYPLNPDEVASILEYGGVFSQHFPQYEYRPQQVEMLRAITVALSEGQHLLVEAGTGTGKSMAYLIPAAYWAIQNQRRVIISTNTINLQDQLINKDIPDLRSALGIDLRASVMKGRGNYLCPRRFENLRRRGPETADEMRILGKVLVWLQTTESGDRSEINLNGPLEREIWQRLSAEDDVCTTENCLKLGGICPFYRARQAAQTSHLLIINHALLLADVATGNRVLPEYDYLIIDEAHHLEDATTNSLSFHTTRSAIERIIRELGGPQNGVVGWLISSLQGILQPADFAAINNQVHRAADFAFQFDNHAKVFIKTIEQFIFEQREGRPVGPYSHQERILATTRTQPAWSDVDIAWDDTAHSLQSLLEILTQLVQICAEAYDALPDDGEELFGSISNLYRRLSEINNHINGLVFEPKSDTIYWVEIDPNGKNLSLYAAPLNIGPLMEQYLWHEKASVILTSATLTTAGEFDYIRNRLYANDAYELSLGSPFDYENSTLLYIANDIPEPRDRAGHQRALEQGIIQLARQQVVEC
jgi:DNA polymerase-3 subunit epsilon/ATP-dependent DNA helicase DinG